MTVKIDGSRSSVAWSIPRAMRAISIASRFRWRPSEYAWIGLSASVSSEWMASRWRTDGWMSMGSTG